MGTRELSLLTNISKYELQIENIYEQAVVDDENRKDNIQTADKLKFLRNSYAKSIKKFWYTVVLFNYFKYTI